MIILYFHPFDLSSEESASRWGAKQENRLFDEVWRGWEQCDAMSVREREREREGGGLWGGGGGGWRESELQALR